MEGIFQLISNEIGTRFLADHVSKRAVPTWPTSGGITEAEAQTRCAHDIQAAQLYHLCPAGSTLYNMYLENCVIDVLVR
jgi:hypothetical protein